jgi:hypothetical protein
MGNAAGTSPIIQSSLHEVRQTHCQLQLEKDKNAETNLWQLEMNA